MSDNLNNRNDMNANEVELYRQQRVQQFKLNINDTNNKTEKQEEKSDFSDEITSFSDESTKAQIERDSKKELRRQKKEERKIERIKSSRNKKVYRIAWLVLVVMITVIITRFLVTGCNDFLAIKRTDSSEATIRIKADYTLSSLADQLEDEGVIDAKNFFVMFAKLTGKADSIIPGVYHIPRDKDYLGILNYLQFSGNVQNTISLTITEGTNVLELVELLHNEGVTAKEDMDEFLRLCNSDEFDDDYAFIAEIKDNPDREYKLEGYLFPDTYEFYIDEAPEQTIRRFLNNFEHRFFDYEYNIEGYDEPVTLSQLMHDHSRYSLDELVNMAAIIQGEAADEEDMKNVSSVIHNRLEYGAQHDIHSLGMDSTAFYPYKDRNSVPSDIKDSFESKYDTYDNAGLPPGAINSPSAHALLCAIVPADTNYLYFCHASDGTAYYASTFYEHQSNLSKAGLD